MRLGHIDYLNCYPFYYKMLEQKSPHGIVIISDYPAELNRLISTGKLDMSPISSALYAGLQNDIVILPQFCLSSIGYVGSVVLASKVPIEYLNKKRIGLTRASHTSVILLKILVEKYFSLKPIYENTNPRPDLNNFDAVLIIGNDAMVGTSAPVPYIYDLGDLWLRKTGYPVVFAVFGIRKEIIESKRKEIESVIASYEESLGFLKNEKSLVIKKAGEKYPDIIFDINKYFDLLQFGFTDDLKKALQFYYNSAEEIGLLNGVKEIKYFI